MMDYKVFKILTIILCLILISNAILACVYSGTPLGIRTKGRKGQPYLFIDSGKYLGEITDVKACNNYLYVLYEAKSILACYDLDGNYQHSYYIDKEKNGQAEMYVLDDTLYLHARGHDFYLFNNGKFSQYFPYNSDEAEQLFDHFYLTEQTTESQKNEYFIHNGSVWKTTANVKTEIIHRPLWMVLFSPFVLWGMGFACFILLILLKFLENRS